MGNEVKGAVRVGKERHEGKILLETGELIFRGAVSRWQLAFGEMREVEAANGELRITTKDGLKIFEVGAPAEKWREKILHPKTRAEKLGVRAGTGVQIVGVIAPEFQKEMKQTKAKIFRPGDSAAADLTFLAVDSKSDLTGVLPLATKLKGAEAVWVVYPKGKKELTENDVIGAGRMSGLKDVKVVRFSATHSALKFVLPLEKR